MNFIKLSFLKKKNLTLENYTKIVSLKDKFILVFEK